MLATELFSCHSQCSATHVQVFVHDPLLQWQMTAKKVTKTRHAHEREAGDGAHDDGGNIVVGNLNAQQAVSRVQVKLKGLDFGEGEPLSVQGQVDQLLVQAMDQERLSKMYAGWAAWL
jgi:phosphatidylinositol kinase/protein kinase (PI-3  family)